MVAASNIKDKCEAIRACLEKNGGSRVLTAKELGITDRTVRRFIGLMSDSDRSTIRSRRHGHRHGHRRLMKIYRDMVWRCHSEKAHNFNRYGALGIHVCQEWLRNPDSFVAWALSSGYRDHLTIDRKNNALGYSPDNCRWATREQQEANKRAKACSQSRYKGVRVRSNRFYASISLRKTRFPLGGFDSEEEAARAYDAKAIELHGEFACLNFPPQPVAAASE